MKKKLVISLGLVCVLVIGFFIGSYFTKEEQLSNITGAIVKDGIIPGYTAEQIQEMMQREADESVFSFEVNARPVFADGDAEGNLRIANPPYNVYAIQVEIKLDDSQKTIFKTVKLQPNQYIEKAKLFEHLEAGEYSATATINAYDIETDEFIGTSSAKLIIKIEN